MCHWATTQNHPVSIRYPKGPIPAEDGQHQTPLDTLESEVLFQSENSDNDKENILLIGVGSMAWECYHAAKSLDQEKISTTALNLRFLKPLKKDILKSHIDKATHIIVVEEGAQIGGVSQYLLSEIDHQTPKHHWHSLGIADEFVDHGKLKNLRQNYDLDRDRIVSHVRNVLNNKAATSVSQSIPHS